MGPEIYLHRRYLLREKYPRGLHGSTLQVFVPWSGDFGRGYMCACRQDVADALWRVSLVRDKVWPAS